MRCPSSKRAAAGGAAAAGPERRESEGSAGGASVREVHQGLLRNPRRLRSTTRPRAWTASSPTPIRWSIRPTPIQAMCEVLPKEAERRRWATWAGSRIFRRTSRYIGYRGSHKIPGSTVDFIYQLEVQPQITHAPGLSTGYTAQSDVTKGGLGYGDSFVGLRAIAGASSSSGRPTRRTRNPRIA